MRRLAALLPCASSAAARAAGLGLGAGRRVARPPANWCARSVRCKNSGVPGRGWLGPAAWAGAGRCEGASQHLAVVAKVLAELVEEPGFAQAG